MRKVLYILIAFNCFYHTELYCQNINKTIVLPEFSVTNSELIPILDSVTTYEKTCPYYSDSVFFIFRCKVIEHVVEVTISALNSMNNPVDFFEFSDIIGHYNHDGFVIFIDRTARDLFFALGEKEKTFHYMKYDDTFQPQDKSILYYIIDDSFTVWSYYYVGDHFVYYGKSCCY